MRIETVISYDMTDQQLLAVAMEAAQNWPETVQCLECVKWDYEAGKFRFIDPEDGQTFKVGPDELLTGFKILLTRYSNFVQPLPTNADSESWGDWLAQADADVFDALVQCCCLGEVVYG